MSTHPVYALDWTEYEFGNRSDGTSIHADLETANAFREQYETGSQEQFWRSSDPRLVMVSKDLYLQMKTNGGSVYATRTKWLKTEQIVAETAV